MNFPPNKFNDYNLIDYLEEYEKYYHKISLFRETFPTFNQFLLSAKKHKPRNIIYLTSIRNEGRKYHKLYN